MTVHLKRLLPILGLIFATASLQGGVGGKLSGRITSASGVPLVGANIVVVGTSLGAATNPQGEYFVLNIPPGQYAVIISMIGYKTHRQEGILIVSDFTTPLHAILEQTALEAEEVVVVADRPLVRRDATSSIAVVTGDEISKMPISDLQDILELQAGFTSDAEGELHVRGGRSREILYIIDGMVVKDPLSGGFTGIISQNAIQELTVISGTFNAEYGEAMSSVVNIVTREGTSQFHGKAEYLSNYLGTSPYHQSFAFSGVRDSAYRHIDLKDPLFNYYEGGTAYPSPIIPLAKIPLSGTMDLSLSGGLPVPNTTYFLSVFSGSKQSHLPHGVDVGQDIQLKVTSWLTPQIKLSGYLQTSSQLKQPYAHSWKYLPDNQAHSFRNTDRYSLGLTHTLGSPIYYTLSLWNLEVGWFEGVRNLQPDEYQRPVTDETVYFNASGNSPNYTRNTSTTRGAKWDLTYQVNQRHQLKTGWTLKQHSLDLYTETQPWDGGVNFKDDTTFKPVEGAFYIQDKIEFDYLILNLGLRYDYLDPRASMWEDVTRFGYLDEDNQFVLAPLLEVPAQTQWSPRVGIAYPVTDQTIFHFSYGHFFQFPSFDAITYNAGKDISASLPRVGNPRVRAQKTVAFETGIKQVLTNKLAFTLTAWMKDITDLLSTEQVRYLSRQYVIYTNKDYGSVRGVDVEIRMRRTGMVSGSLGYTLSVAKGNNSDPLGGYFSAYTQEEIPHQEYYLDFDQRHDISLNLDLVTPSGLVANFLLSAGSGLPYTPYVDPTIRVPINSGRKPWTFNGDVRLRKGVQLGTARLEGLLEITNLTNYRNVYYVYSRTGKPFDPGFSGVGTSADANHNPARIGPPRMIKAGFNVSW